MDLSARNRLAAIALQAAVLVGLAAGIAWLAANAAASLERQNIASGFGFLSRTAGFDISQSLIAYANTDTYARAFWVGLFNTLLVAALGIVLSTVLGFAIGIARLSSNWLVARVALVYVELVRNVPLLLWLLMVYFGMLLRLPPPEHSIALPFGALLNRRGLYLPAVEPTATMLAAFAFAAAGIVAAMALARVRKPVPLADTTGPAPLPSRTEAAGWAALFCLPALVVLASGGPLRAEAPELGRFNLEGGVAILPELIALLTGLVSYTAAYIGEVVRAGIVSVPTGQRQAAAALGLSGHDTLWRIVVPQGMRAIVPPLTNQYVNLTKNSSLAVAVGYPDLVSVFAGTILNHTNQAVETIAITMVVYLALSLATATAMGFVNARYALKER